MAGFETMHLPAKPNGVAPDGTDVRALLSLRSGSFAHFTLAPGRVSTAVEHRTVEEIWYVVSGRGELWRRRNGREDVAAIEAGTCVTIPLGTSFQFRVTGDTPLEFVAVTMLPWPGSDEAFTVEGPWTPTVARRF